MTSDDLTAIIISIVFLVSLLGSSVGQDEKQKKEENTNDEKAKRDGNDKGNS